jgi:phosphohistidine phosphatase
MKQLIFVRHGKAEEGLSAISDFERSLTLKGKVVSRYMACELKKKEKSPGIILTSPAFRALETALIFADEFGVDASAVVIKTELYSEINMDIFHDILSGLDEDAKVITMFGHNPSFTEIANSLSNKGCDLIPKSGIVCISFNINKWSEVEQKKGKTEYFINPEKTQ